MSLTFLTLVHTALSLAGLVLGFYAIAGLLNPGSQRTATRWFLGLAVLATATGFLFPFTVVTPAFAVGLISTVVLVVFAGTPGPWAFWLFLGYMIVQFSAMGFLLGNINALALEPMGHVAGMAASLVNGLATVLAALLVMPLTAVFDGTPVPMAATVLISTILNATAMRRARHYH